PSVPPPAPLSPLGRGVGGEGRPLQLLPAGRPLAPGPLLPGRSLAGDDDQPGLYLLLRGLLRVLVEVLVVGGGLLRLAGGQRDLDDLPGLEVLEGTLVAGQVGLLAL